MIKESCRPTFEDVNRPNATNQKLLMQTKET